MPWMCIRYKMKSLKKNTKYKKAKKEFRMNIELDGIEMQISQVEYFSSKIILKALKSTLLQITELDSTVNYLK